MGRNKGLPKQLTEKQELLRQQSINKVLRAIEKLKAEGKERDDYGAGGIHRAFPVCIF